MTNLFSLFVATLSVTYQPENHNGALPHPVGSIVHVENFDRAERLLQAIVNKYAEDAAEREEDDRRFWAKVDQLLAGNYRLPNPLPDPGPTRQASDRGTGNVRRAEPVVPEGPAPVPAAFGNSVETSEVRRLADEVKAISRTLEKRSN